MPLIPPGLFRKTRGIIRFDTRANQPASTDVLPGTLYYVTDESVLERCSDDNTTWDSLIMNGGAHGDLTGLSNDDHLQYALLAGRSGGQDLKGGTGVTDGLSLQSTAGNGTSRTDFIKFLLGNNGAQDSGRWINNAGAGFLLINESALKFTGVASAKGGIEVHVETDVNFATTPSIDVPSGVAFHAYNDAVGANVGFEFRGQPIGFTIGLSIFTQHFARSGTITPSALAAGNNNDWNPTGLGGETSSGAYCIRMTGDAGGTSKITGIDGGLNYSLGGRELLLINVGSFQIEIMHEDANSAADNRIITPTAASIIFSSSDSCQLWYDASTARWRMVNVCR